MQVPQRSNSLSCRRRDHNRGWLPGNHNGNEMDWDRRMGLGRSQRIRCVQSRKPTITPVETAHHSTIPGHLGLISMLVGRKLQWDVAQEKILNDSSASEL